MPGQGHGKREANAISILSPTTTQTDVDPIFFSQISSPRALLFAPEPAAHSQSKTWKSSDTKEKDQYVRLSTLLHHYVPESPFVPRTYAVWVQHRASVNAMELDNVRSDIAIKQSRNTVAAKVPIKPVLGGKEFTDNRSAVLSHKTVWATWSLPTDEHPEALWPDRTEFQYEGDDRARSDVGRFLPLPRMPGNETVNWKAREQLQPYRPLDHVGMFREDGTPDIEMRQNCDGWEKGREHEEIIGRLLGGLAGNVLHGDRGFEMKHARTLIVGVFHGLAFGSGVKQLVTVAADFERISDASFAEFIQVVETFWRCVSSDLSFLANLLQCDGDSRQDMSCDRSPMVLPRTRFHITIHKANFASQHIFEMAQDLNIYDEVEIEDMIFDKTLQIYHYPCPCGDRFEIGIADLRDGEEIAVCPGCSLMIKVIFDLDDLSKDELADNTAPATAIQA